MGDIPLKRMILSRTDRDNAHPNSHWVAGLKKYWQQHVYILCQFIADALVMAEKEYGINTKPLLPHYDAILYIGQDGK